MGSVVWLLFVIERIVSLQPVPLSISTIKKQPLQKRFNSDKLHTNKAKLMLRLSLKLLSLYLLFTAISFALLAKVISQHGS